MAQRSFPFDAGAGATISETDWQNMARRFRQTGVIEGSLSQLAVSADGSSLAVSVATGDAFVEGFFYRNDAALALTIAAANATNPRIDTVVVRLDRVANTATLAVVTGTPAASPVAPTLSTADSLYELPLANVTVPAAAGVIVAGNVTDRRSITQTFDSAAYASRLYKGARVAKTAVQSIPSATLTVLTFDSENWDRDGWHDNAMNNSRLTVPAGLTGHFQVTAVLGMAGTSGTYREVYLRRNGANFGSTHSAPAGFGRYLALAEVDAVPGDYFDVAVKHDAATALDATLDSYFIAHFIGASS